MEYFLQADQKDIQTFEYFASETQNYDDDIHVIEMTAFTELQEKYRLLSNKYRTMELMIEDLKRRFKKPLLIKDGK